MGEVDDDDRADGGEDDPVFSAAEIAEMERLAVEHRERTRRLGGWWALFMMDVEQAVYGYRSDLARWRRRRVRR